MLNNKSMLNEEMLVSCKDGSLIACDRENFEMMLGLNRKNKFMASFIEMANNAKENIINFIEAHKERCLKNGIAVTPVRYQMSRTI